MRHFLRAACAATAVAVLASCSDSPTGPDLDPGEGLLTFEYTGAVQGEFSARGGEQLTQPPTTPYAEALREVGFSGIQAGYPRANGRLDAVTLVGNFDFSERTVPACVPGTQVPLCMNIRVFLDTDGFSDRQPGERFFTVATSGTIRIDRVTETRVRGSFSGTLRDPLTNETIQVTDGRFDLPLRDFPL
jgi:hypothetical protein